MAVSRPGKSPFERCGEGVAPRRVRGGEAPFPKPDARQSPCDTTSRQAARISSGTSKGGDVQPKAARVAAATSSAPSGAPCAAAVPAFLGAPKPITVRAAIRVGVFAWMARSSAAAMASGSWPSTRLGRSSRRRRSGRVCRRTVAEAGSAVDGRCGCRPRSPSAWRDGDGRRTTQPHGSSPPLGRHRRTRPKCGGRRDHRRNAPPPCARRAPSRRRWRCPGRAARWVTSMPRLLSRSRVAGRRRAERAEGSQRLERHAGIARQVQQAVQEHRAMPARQDEAVPVGPGRRGRVEPSACGVNSAVATSANPRGRPGWPELARSTASMARKRKASAMRAARVVRAPGWRVADGWVSMVRVLAQAAIGCHIGDLAAQRLGVGVEAANAVAELVAGHGVVVQRPPERGLVTGDARHGLCPRRRCVEGGRDIAGGGRQLGQQRRGDRQPVAAGERHHLISGAERGAHHHGLVVEVLEVGPDLPNRQHAWILLGRVAAAGLLAVPVEDSANEGRDQERSRLGGGDGLGEAEHQGDVAADPLPLEDLGRAGCLPRWRRP